MAEFWNRLKHDFQLSIIMLVGLCAFIGITPYAVYRLIEGNYLVGVVDSILVLCTIGAVRWAWVTGDTIRPGQFLAVIFSVGAVIVANNLGVNGLFWFYTLIMFNFFVVPPLQSLLATSMALLAICVLGLMPNAQVFESNYQMMSFVVTSGIASFFAFVFAFRGRRQREQLNTLATLDPLTSTANRRTMERELSIAMAEYRRYGKQFGILMLDLDHFKRVNDLYGHKAGDQVLVEVASLLESASRESDRLFRLGGEEFVLLLPQVDRLGLERAAKHLCNAVAEQIRSPGGPVTVSIGGASLGQQENWQAWLHEADECLYQAKHAGRNGYRVSGLDTSARQALKGVSGTD